MKKIKANLKRILVIFMLIVVLMFSLISSISDAKSMLPDEGEFYYSGTTEGKYVVTESWLDWLIDNLGAILDWFLGLNTYVFRMVLIGWTSIGEKLLTWALESTMNMYLTVDDINLSATDVTTIEDSSKIVTVEAIVFNLVPIFDINLFNFNYSKLLTGTGVDLSVYKCETCGNGIELCQCENCTCEACKVKRTYDLSEIFEIENGTVKRDSDGNPVYKTNVVKILKETVAKWYYIMRLIAIAIMLIVLLVAGIKIAISSVAEEKALYKRILTDWVTGMILLFLIHYIMVVIINVNDNIVELVRDSCMSSVDKEETLIDGSTSASYIREEVKKTNSNVEISLYEEVKTRAYDAKLINGVTGLVMYMTLVYFAWRFSLIYLKRSFTIIILTLMGPGVALAYSIQKVLTGRSSSFKTWLREYVLTVIMQIIHAIIYSSFVSLALELSLNSLSGAIIAFIILNFMTKAEKLFRKIFNFSTGFLEETMEAGSPSRVQGALRKAVGLKSAAKPVANFVKGLPSTRALKEVGLLARDSAILGISKLQGEKALNRSSSNTNGHNENSTNLEDTNDRPNNSGNGNNSDSASNLGLVDLPEGLDKDTALGEAIQAEFKYRNNIGSKEDEENKEEALKAWTRYSMLDEMERESKKESGLSSFAVYKAHLKKLFDYNNYYDVKETTDKDGKKVKRLVRIKGRKEYDSHLKKNVRINGTRARVNRQVSSEELLGMDEKDIKEFKNVMSFAGKGLLGLGGMMLGIGTFTSNPQVGMALLTSGVSGISSIRGKNTKRNISGAKSGVIKVYPDDIPDSREAMLDELGFEDERTALMEAIEPQEERYTFNRFSAGAMSNINSTLNRMAEADMRDINIERTPGIERVQEGIENGTLSPRGTVNPETTANSSQSDEKASSSKPKEKGPLSSSELNFIKSKVAYEGPNNAISYVGHGIISYMKNDIFGGIGGKMDEVSLKQYKKIGKLIKEQNKVAVVEIGDELKVEYQNKFQELENAVNGVTDDTSVNPPEATTIFSNEKIRRAINKVADERGVTVDKLDLNNGTIMESVVENLGKEVKNTGFTKPNIEGINIFENAVNSLNNGELDKDILTIKQQLDMEADAKKNKTKKMQNLKKILIDNADSESESTYIEEKSGVDLENLSHGQITNAEISQINGLSKKEQNIILELLLLQKQMREINVKADTLGMKTADKRYQAARTKVLKANTNTQGRVMNNSKKENAKYGPVLNIPGIINSL